MKKVIVFLLGLFMVPLSVLAVPKMDQSRGVGVEKSESVIQRGKNVKLDQVEVSPQSGVLPTTLITRPEQKEESKNKLRFRIQKKGKGQQFPVKTKGEKSKGIRRQVRQMAIEQAGKAAENAFQQMTQTMDEEMGLGEKVRELAKEHKQVQEKVNQGVQKVKKRNRFMKFLFGPNKKALADLEDQIAANQEVIGELNQMTKKADETAAQRITAAKEIISQQNDLINQTIAAEKQTPGIFSFLTKLFR